MVRFLSILVVVGTVVFLPAKSSAADWSQGQWQILYTEPTDSLMSVRGLDCSDGTVHLVLTVQEPSGGYRFRYHRWSPSGHVGPMDWPDDLRRWFRDMNYDSVDRHQPAFLSTTTLWRMTEQGWDSLSLAENAWDVPYPQCFTFDSSGAMHYVLHNWNDLYYIREGGNRPARRDTIHCNFELGCSSGNATRICAPTAQSVVFVIGWDDALGWVPNFWNLIFFHASEDEPFSSVSDGQECGRSNPQLVLSTRGEWIYGIYLRSVQLHPKVWTGTDGLPGPENFPFGTQTGPYCVYDISFDSTFEIAAAILDQSPTTVQFAILNQELQFWEEDTSFVLPTDHHTFHINVDSLGRGHLFTVDSTHLWYFGPDITGKIRNPFVLQPSSFTLSSYPNPFNPSTTIAFSLPQAQIVRLAVYDITGREVAVLADELFVAGEHQVTFDGTQLPSGIYFARIETPPLAPPLKQGGTSRTVKMVLLK